VRGSEPLMRLHVGVVVERRKASSAWAEFVWRPVAVLPGVPDAAPWTVLGGSAECATIYAGSAAIELYRADAAGYRDNLATGTAQLWVALRPTGGEPPYEISAITAEPSEGEAFNETATDLVEAVPMPDSIRATIATFVAEHLVEHAFVKRQRDRADPEAMARRPPVKDRE
jgi:hypothetical protein